MVMHPQAINRAAIQAQNAADDYTRDYLSNFRYHQRKAPGYVGIVRDLQLMNDVINDVQDGLVIEMRKEGFSWTEIGDVFGITRQAAHKRFRWVAP